MNDKSVMRKMRQQLKNYQGSCEFFPEDFSPPAELLSRMKVTWPQFVEIFETIFYTTEGERLSLLAEGAGISRPEAAYLSVGSYDGHSKRTGLNWID